MKKIPASLFITKVEYLTRYTLRIQFSDGTVQTVDFEPFLEGSRHPEIRKYLDLKSFKNFHCEHGELMWGDFDLIFPIGDLYQNAIGV